MNVKRRNFLRGLVSVAGVTAAYHASAAREDPCTPRFIATQRSLVPSSGFAGVFSSGWPMAPNISPVRSIQTSCRLAVARPMS
jgi:hypothetical protein